MATLEEIGKALKNAHAAGDVAAATKLAQAYQREKERANKGAAGKRGGMVKEETISREEYMAQRGGAGFGGRPVPKEVGTYAGGPMATYADEGLLGKKPVASEAMIRDVGATKLALETPQDMNVNKMSRAQSVALGVNDLNPVRLATGDRGYEAAMTESLKDNPFSTRIGQTAALTAGGGAQLTNRALVNAPKLVAPALAAKFAGSRVAPYLGRAGVLAGTGAADFYAYNALAEAPNQAREQGLSSPTAGQRMDYANSQVFTPAGIASAVIPVAGSAIYRGVRGGLAAGKNIATTGSATTRRVDGQTQQVPVANLFTPADIQKRVAGLSGSLTTMTRDDATKAIDMLLRRGFDPDEAEKMVKFLDYAGKSEVPEMLFQIMPDLRKVDQLAVALGTVGGDAQKALGDALGKQAQESPVILRNALRKAMGISGKDFYAMEKGIRADQLSAPAAGYKAAYGKEVSDETWQNQILPQLRTKYGREAVSDAADYAEGIAGTDPAQLAVARQLAELRDAIGSQGATPGKVSTQSLDYIDRMLGDMAQGLKSGSGRKELAKGPVGAQRGIRGNADAGLDAETGLDAPRRLSAELKTAEEALEFGRKAFRSGTDIETLQDEFARQIAKLGEDGGESETVRGALLMGWLRGAEDEISTATNPQSVIRRIYGSERQREKLVAMMPELADDAGAGAKGSNTKDIRALVGGKREDGREMAGMIDRLKRISGDYNRIIGNSQSAQRIEAVAEQGGSQDKLNFVLDAFLNTKEAALKAGRGAINYATRPGIYQPGVNRELGRLLTARGKKQLLSVIEEIRARQAATGKGPKPSATPPAGAAPAGAPVPPPKPPGKLGTRTADAAAIAMLATGGPTAEADTGDPQARIDALSQQETAAQQLISEYDQALKSFEAMAPKEKQVFLKNNGYTGRNGETINPDGDVRGITGFAIETYKNELKAAKEAQQAERDVARNEITKVRVGMAERQENPPNPLIDKAAELGTYAAMIYGAHRLRGAAIKGSQKSARLVADDANALLTRLPVPLEAPRRTLTSRVPVLGSKEAARIKTATNAANKAARATEERLAGRDIPPISSNPTSENGLPIRTANLQEFDRRQAAGDFGPVGPIGRFMEPINSRVRAGDLGLIGAGAADAHIMQGMLDKTRADIDAEEARLKEARAKNNGLGDPNLIDASNKRLEQLRKAESVQTILQRVGVGLMIGGTVALAHGRYSRPQPRFEAANRERELIRLAQTPPPPPAPLTPPPTKSRKPSVPRPKPLVSFSSARPRKPANDNDN